MKSKWIHEITGLEHIVGYKVFEDGSVVSYLKRHDHSWIISNEPKKTLKPFVTRKGYLKVELKGRGYSVHRLVALAFLHNPESKEQVNHIDGEKKNNRVSNLEWSTQSENQKHNVFLGIHNGPRGDSHYAKHYGDNEHHACKNICQLDLYGNLIAEHPSVKSASLLLNIDRTSISKALKGVIKTSGGFKWVYCKKSE